MFINEDGDKKKVLLNAAGDSFLLLSILMFQPASRILIRLLLPCRNDSARIGGTFTRRRYFSSCIAHVTAITIAIRDSRSGTTAASPSPSFFSFLPSPFSLQSLSLSFSFTRDVFPFYGKFRWRALDSEVDPARRSECEKCGFRPAARKALTDKVPLTSSIFCSHPVLPYRVSRPLLRQPSSCLISPSAYLLLKNTVV